MKGIDKYIFCCALAFCIFRHVNAQVTRQTRRRHKTETVANDTTQTMTHTMPMGPMNKQPQFPKKPTIRFSHAKEALYMELETFTNATPNDVKCVFSPLVVIKPFIRFYDKFDIGITTTQMVQNYTNPNMSTMTYDIYAYTKLGTSGGNFTLRTGKFSVFNYAGPFLKYMPINNFFITALYMQSGHYYPRAIVLGFQNDVVAMHVGYAEENHDGFKFTGNGAIVVATETFVEDWFKCGLLLTMGNPKTIIDFQMVYTPNNRNALLLEVMNIGNRAGIHGTYRYTCKRDNMDIFANGFYQIRDGVAGGSLGLRHAKSGAYAAVGATYHDPLRATCADGTPNELYDKIVPFVECGIVRGILK